MTLEGQPGRDTTDERNKNIKKENNNEGKERYVFTQGQFLK